MLTKLKGIIIIFLCIDCKNADTKFKIATFNILIIIPKTVAEIPLPVGYERLSTDCNSFDFYLQHFKLKSDKTIYYFDGTIKENQSMQYAVLDIAIGNKNLMQCADAIMRIRAGYFFNRKEYNKIVFKSANKTYSFVEYLRLADTENIQKAFNTFMETVYDNCGTYNLSESMKPKKDIKNIAIGDVLVKGGSPGHAMIVMDVAVNKKTKQRIYLLAQGYMPAQSIHIVINPMNHTISPWYVTDEEADIITPGYLFKPGQLKRW